MSSNGLENGYGIDGTTINAGTSSNPYAINDFADLSAITSHVSEGAYYQQTADITLTSSISFSNIEGNYNGDGYVLNGGGIYLIHFGCNSGDVTKCKVDNVYFLNVCPPFGNSVLFTNCCAEDTTGNTYTSAETGIFGRNDWNGYETCGPNATVNCIIKGYILNASGGGVYGYGGIFNYTIGGGGSRASYCTNCVAISTTANRGYRISANGSVTTTNCYASSDCSPTSESADANSANGATITADLYENSDFWFNNEGGSLSQAYLNYDKTIWEWDAATSLPKLRHRLVYISTAQELIDFADRVNAGETDLDGILTANINLTGKTWTPIAGYAGNFNGAGYTISHLENVFMSGSGTLKNTSFESITVSLSSQVMLVNLSTISNCRAKEITLTANSYCCVFYATAVNNCVVIDSTITGGGTGGGSAFTTTYSVTTYVNDSVGIRNTISNFALLMRINAQDMNYHVTNCYDSSGGSSTSDRNGLLVSSTLYENPDFWFNNEGGSLSQTYLNYDTNVWEWDAAENLPRLKRNSTTPTVKVHNGTDWVDGTPHVWNGTEWKQADKVYVHNGSEWKEGV